VHRGDGVKELPDIVISGVNHGANMGDDTIYSGTVAAATEGLLLGIPSIAISLVSEGAGNFRTAGRVAMELVSRFQRRPLDGPVLLNVNVPDVDYGELRGFQVTRLGKRHKAEPVVKSTTPRGETVYWVGAAGGAQDAGDGTDFHAIAANRVSITPLQMDLTRFAQLESVATCSRAPTRDGCMVTGSSSGIGMTSQRTRLRMVERSRPRHTRRGGVVRTAELPRHI
jgi:5'-nucleotidase